jgi:hypothetical protein
MFHRPGGATDPQQAAAQKALQQQNDTRDPATKDPSNPSRPKTFTPGPGDPTQTAITPEKLKQQGIGLSNREAEAQGNPAANEALKWQEGVKTWVMKKEHEWTAAQKALKIPLGAGPSGTTSALFQVSKMLGYNDNLGIRMACIGYILPINAHSLVEVLTAAAAHGCPPPQGQKMYKKIDPLSEDQLRACGRPGGKDGKNLFPDDPPP